MGISKGESINGQLADDGDIQREESKDPSVRPTNIYMQVEQCWMTSECMILLSLATNFPKDQGQDPRSQ